MKNSVWFSPRGARRGVLLAALAAALWCSWAVGYLQGSSPEDESAKHASQPSKVQSVCCVPTPST
ncbi:hypothetical protein [Limnohabitans sp.]|jgi:hypothetical protein